MRILDLIFSLFALFVLLLPIMLLCFLLKITGEGEVFYKQLRVGKNGKHFYVFKYATMLKESEKLPGGTLTFLNDPRVLPLGRFLRITKINEIPQLFNILLGDMSVVGPRPLVPSGESYYSNEQSQIIRSVKPGLTGIGSIALRDEESLYAHRKDAACFYKDVIAPYKANLEIWYVANQSVALYLKIVFFTFLVIVFPRIKLEKYFPNLPQRPLEM
jgi:lipopolysaccharide/colanic/teichoic acid biosynthesis glycosyltransferase